MQGSLPIKFVIIITISANESRREISKDIQIAEIEKGITHLSKGNGGELMKEVLEFHDEEIRHQVSKKWKNVMGKSRKIKKKL